jgi:ATP-dependent Clp protease ATP-binding subunit ClpX
LFFYDSVKLTFDDNALDEIANLALEKGTGARALRSIMENLLLNLMFDLPYDHNISEVYITKPYVQGIDDPLFIKRDNYARL